MLKAMSTYVFVKERLHPGLLENLVRGGAEAIEIFAARGHFDYANRRQHVLEIAAWFKDSGVTLNSLHSPMYNTYVWGQKGVPAINIADTDRKGRVEAMDEIKRALEVAEQIPFRFLVQHIGIGGEEFSDRKFDSAMSSLEHLRAFAKPLGVKLLLENIPNELSTPDRLLEMLRIAHFDDIGICFDVGHAHMASDVATEFATLKDHIRSTHVHDNGKDRDAHLWPGGGSIDWPATMSLLRSAPHLPPLLMEIEGEEKVNVSEKMGEAFRKLEQAEQKIED